MRSPRTPRFHKDHQESTREGALLVILGALRMVLSGFPISQCNSFMLEASPRFLFPGGDASWKEALLW